MAETEFKYDVFISYSHKDEEWADKVLCQHLDDAGLKVCIDYRDFEAGKMALLNMQDAAKQSQHVVLVLTRNWLNSEWSLFEALVGGTKDPAGLQKKLIPLLCEAGIEKDINDFIAMRTWVDFTRKDRETIAWKQLFSALGKPEAFKPTTPKPDTGSREAWHLAHPYPMPPNFTGRDIELKMLDDWLADNTNRLFILRALGGFGKSALAWQWINTHVNPAEWTKLVFWSFYEGDASFEHFIEETLKYLKLDVPQGQRPQVDELLKAMQSQKILLIMDGFERALRAYSSMNAAYQGDEGPKIEDNQLDCVNINAEIFLKSICSLPNIKSKVLMTTRLTPRAVKPRGEFMLGCHEEELTAMQPTDTVEFFHKQKIKGTHAEIEAACEPYGYHPLSLRILAGLIIDDRKIPGDISVANKLKITDNIIQNKHHVLEVAYNTLLPEQQKLLSTIACFRSPMNYETLKEISSKPLGKGRKAKTSSTEKLDDNLKTLETRGLLHWDRKANKYDLHPIVRRFAYNRLTTPEQAGVHVVLVVYFEAVPQPQKIEKLEDLAPVIELYHHMVRSGKLDEARNLFRDRLSGILYYQFGAYQTVIELLNALFLDGEDNLPRLKEKIVQGWTTNSIANAYSFSGQPRRAEQAFKLATQVAENLNDKKNTAVGLGNTACMAQIYIGALREAESNLRRRIELSNEIQEEFDEAVGRQELGRLLVYRGSWDESKRELAQSTKYWKEIKDYDGLCIDSCYRSLLFLQMQNSKNALLESQNAFNAWEEDAKGEPKIRTFVITMMLLGTSCRLEKQLDLAERYLSEALMHCRAINLVETEADILLNLACLRYDQNRFEEAKSIAEEALSITERCGYVLQGADVNLFLAQYSLEQEQNKAKAKEYAEEAKKLATCDGPPYYYKVAYEEAERRLERLK